MSLVDSVQNFVDRINALESEMFEVKQKLESMQQNHSLVDSTNTLDKYLQLEDQFLENTINERNTLAHAMDEAIALLEQTTYGSQENVVRIRVNSAIGKLQRALETTGFKV